MPKSVDTYATTSPDGRVSFDFSGRISAEGITLPAQLPAAPEPLESSIVWIRQDDGSLVAEITEFSTINSDALALYCKPRSATNNCNISLIAGGQPAASGNNRESDIIIERGQTDTETQTTVSAKPQGGGTWRNILINANGECDYLQMKSTLRVQVLLGSVTLSMPVGLNAIVANLSAAWTSAHFLAVASTSPFLHHNFNITQVSANGLSQILVVVNNTGVVQDFTFNYVSYGAD